MFKLDPLQPGDGYQVVYSDPPWAFASNSKANPGRNAMRHYDCMSLADIAALPVKEVVADDAVLFLWITSPFLILGAHLDVMKGWGFKPSGLGFTWIKTRRKHGGGSVDPDRDLFMGGGFTTRKNAEFCLIGKRGRSLRKDAGVHEVVVSPVREHSRKPEEVRRRIERYAGDVKRLELFAREQSPGWTVWGNQTDKFAEASK